MKIHALLKLSVPGAIAHFGLTDEKLDALVDAKLGKAAVAAVVPAAITAPLALPGAVLSGLAEAGEAVTAPLSALAAGALGGR